MSSLRTASPLERVRTWRDALFTYVIPIVMTVMTCGILGLLMLGGPATHSLGDVTRVWRSAPDTHQAGSLRRIWGMATVVADDPPRAGAAICHMLSEHYVSGRSGGWRESGSATTVLGGAKLQLDDGRRLDLTSRAARFEPFQGEQVAGLSRAEVRELTAGMSLGERLRMQCAREGERVFIDGCSDGTQLTGCGASLPTLSTSPGRRAFRSLFRWGVLGCMAIVALLLLAWWRLHRHTTSSRSIRLDEYIGRLEDPAALRKAWLRAAVPLLPIAPLVLLGSLPWTLLLLAACIGVSLLMAHFRRQHARSLDSHLALLDELPTASLQHAEGSRLELALQVDRGAPPRLGPVSGEERAFVFVESWQRVVIKSGKSEKVEYRYPRSGILGPEQLAVRDASGQGSLNLRDAILDLPAVERLYPAGAMPEAVSSLLGAHLLGDYLVRESWLAPGDSLYVLGQVVRHADGAGNVASYRSAATRPEVGAFEGALFVHAGTEQSLSRQLQSLRDAEQRLGQMLLGTSWLFGAALALAALTGLR